jgi:hypothetical protein
VVPLGRLAARRDGVVAASCLCRHLLIKVLRSTSRCFALLFLHSEYVSCMHMLIHPTCSLFVPGCSFSTRRPVTCVRAWFGQHAGMSRVFVHGLENTTCASFIRQVLFIRHVEVSCYFHERRVDGHRCQLLYAKHNVYFVHQASYVR